MNTRISFKKPAILGISSLLVAGCFEHREAPTRPVIADGMEEAIELRQSVQVVKLVDFGESTLPAELAEMPRLESLVLQRSSVTNFTALGSLKALRMLDLAESKIARLPAEVLALTNLRHLYLGSNSLAEIPGGIGDLSELSYLNCDRNQLAELNGEIGLLRKLRWLRLNHNRLAKLPAELGQCQNLQRIYLRSNQIGELPESLERCELIEDVALSDNMLREFPVVLTKLPRLRNLDLSRNPIATWPVEEIAQMKSLRTLTLTGCQVPREVQTELRRLLSDCLITY